MSDQPDNKMNQAAPACLPLKPYLAVRRRGADPVLIFVDGRRRISTGVVCKAAASARARRRLKRKVLASYLRAAAVEFARNDDDAH